MWEALAARHAAPCERVTASSRRPAADLLAVVDLTTSPPWAPMRAADCLVRHHAAEPRVIEAMRLWVEDPARLGLGRLVVTRIDDLEPARALELARRAWNADHDRAWLARRLEESTRSEIRALVP
ncbi:MAG: hypothetical protein AAF602_21395 [Myxococcota bacterium]